MSIVTYSHTLSSEWPRCCKHRKGGRLSLIFSSHDLPLSNSTIREVMAEESQAEPAARTVRAMPRSFAAQGVTVHDYACHGTT